MAVTSLADLAAAWDRNADSWTAQVREGRDAYRETYNMPLFLCFLPKLEGLDVLDLGCGEGMNTRLLAHSGARMQGIDLSARLIEAARAAEAAAPLGIRYTVGSFETLDAFSDESFDAAVSTVALMDSPGFRNTARAAFRVLRAGGTLTFSVTHPCFTTRNVRWLRDDDGVEQGLVVADYFAAGDFVERWRFKFGDETTPPFDVPRFSHRLEDYVNGLCEAGFRIRKMANRGRRKRWLRHIRGSRAGGGMHRFSSTSARRRNRRTAPLA